MAPHIDQNSIALRLTGETRAGRAESHAFMLLPRIAQYLADVVGIARDYDDLWKKAVGARICSIADQINRPAENSVGAK